MKKALAASVRPPVLLALSVTVVLAGCLAKPAQFDPLDPTAGGGAGGGPTETGAGGAAGSGRGGTKDGPGSAGTAGTGGFVCEPGSPCVVPGKPCIVGSTVCEGVSATCAETTRLQANGSPCGGDSVCLDGICSACKAGLECPLQGAPCKSGAIECGTGKPECNEGGNAPNGASCGSAMVCKEGTCMACQAGDSCLPANPCHEGTLDCAGGGAACTDSGRVKAAGSQCGVNKVCGPAGECVACVAGMACELQEEPCKTGRD